MEERLPRKLAAILYADVAGYSRLTGEDEDATHVTLSEYLDLIAGTIEQHRGRVIHYAGDAVLATFEAVVDAISCAADVQREFRVLNEDVPGERRVQFRIGVNLGDVIEDREDIYGDGVNVAARLESLAEPGGICISRYVYDQVKNKLDLGYEFVGEKRFKNIAEPVAVYRVLLEPEVAGTVADSKGVNFTGWQWLGLATVVAVAVGGVTAWLEPWAPDVEPVALEESAFPLPDRPSIAVLPFDNMSGDPEQDYFTDGMTDDLITDLSGISGLLVIARNSVFIYKDKPVEVRQLARELGVRYILEGSVRRAGDRLRINAQLVDAITGAHVWAERYDERLVDVFTLQDKVTRKIVAALEVTLTPQEQVLASGSQTRNVDAYDAYLKGWASLLRKTSNDALDAIALFERALELDPDYSDAYVALAQTYWDHSIDRDFNEATDPPLGASFPPSGYANYLKALKFLLKVRDHPSSQAHALYARMLQRQRRFDEALDEARQAVAMGPNNPSAYDALIETLIYANEGYEALSLIDESLRLDPNLPGEKLFLRGMAYYTMGRLKDAVSTIERARRHNPEQTRYAAIQAAALAELGRLREAESALQEYLSEWSTSADLNWAMFHWPFKRLSMIERLSDSLTNAGLAAPAKRYYLATDQDRLTSEQIRSLLAGKTMIGRNRGYFGAVDLSALGVTSDEFEVTRDQEAQIIRQGELGYFRSGEETRIEDNLLCDYWRDFLGHYCVAIYSNPHGSLAARDEYVFFTLMSIFSFSVIDSPTS